MPEGDYLLTERPTLGNSRSCHDAWADLLRKQQVLGSNPSVGSNFLARTDLRSTHRQQLRAINPCVDPLSGYGLIPTEWPDGQNRDYRDDGTDDERGRCLPDRLCPADPWPVGGQDDNGRRRGRQQRDQVHPESETAAA